MTENNADLAHGLAAMLDEIIRPIRAGYLPRWLMVNISPSVAMVRHLVRDFLARQDALRPLPPTPGCTVCGQPHANAAAARACADA